MYLRQFCYNLFTLNLIYADSKFEVKLLPAGKNFELDILAPFMNDRLAVICYFTYDGGFIDIEFVNDMQTGGNSKQQL